MSHADVHLLCGGKFHDFDYVRNELQHHLEKLNVCSMNNYESYSQLEPLNSNASFITYTSDLTPDSGTEDMLDTFLTAGGRWLALHGTNSVVEIDDDGYAHCPKVDSKFMRMLGSQFLAHPPKQDFFVEPSDSTSPLIDGIDKFEVNDELYFVDLRGEIEVLLQAHSDGKAMRGFKQRDYPSDKPQPIMYLRKWGQGEVLYLNLGHSRGHHDMKPLIDFYEPIERGSWTSPVFRELLDRSLKWLVRET